MGRIVKRKYFLPLLLLITFTTVIVSFIGILIILFLILFMGYAYVIEPNLGLLLFEIIMISFGLISFLNLIPKIMRKVSNEIF